VVLTAQWSGGSQRRRDGLAGSQRRGQHVEHERHALRGTRHVARTSRGFEAAHTRHDERRDGYRQGRAAKWTEHSDRPDGNNCSGDSAQGARRNASSQRRLALLAQLAPGREPDGRGQPAQCKVHELVPPGALTNARPI
jgi:hypothetical protein